MTEKTKRILNNVSAIFFIIIILANIFLVYFLLHFTGLIDYRYCLGSSNISKIKCDKVKTIYRQMSLTQLIFSETSDLENRIDEADARLNNLEDAVNNR